MGGEEKRTKRDILETALHLFSQRGFSAVSIRDICREVGIKESTVYYHFENKQDIFQSLLGEFEEITKRVQDSFNSELSRITRVEEEAFVLVGLGFLNNYLLNGRILEFLRMLMIEQHVNTEAASLYRRVLFEAPLRHNAAVFERLMQMGCFREDDSERLALEYYAPVFLLFQRYFACGEATAQARAEADRVLTVHLRSFYGRYNVPAL